MKKRKRVDIGHPEGRVRERPSEVCPVASHNSHLSDGVNFCDQILKETLGILRRHVEKLQNSPTQAQIEVANLTIKLANAQLRLIRIVMKIDPASPVLKAYFGGGAP